MSQSHPALRSSIHGDLVTLDVLADDARPRLVEASQLTDSLRRYDDSYHNELQWWTTSFRQSEGVPESALISRSEHQRVGVGRSFPVSGYGGVVGRGCCHAGTHPSCCPRQTKAIRHNGLSQGFTSERRLDAGRRFAQTTFE